MALTATAFEADVAFVETDTAALGATLSVLLPDGNSMVTATRHGANEALRMFDEGYGDKRTDTFEIRASEFTRCNAPVLKFNDTINEKIGDESRPWMVKDVQKPDSIVFRFAVVQAW
jgi:hypothetical protein